MSTYLRNNIWQISYPNPITGKLCRESTGLKNGGDPEDRKKIKKLAEAIYSKKLVETAENKFLDKKVESELTLEAFFQDYFKNHSKLKKTAWKLDEYHINKVYTFFPPPTLINTIKRKSVVNYRVFRQENGASNATINREVSLLIAMFNKAVEWEYIEANPLARIEKLQESEPRERNLSKTEIEWVINWLKANGENYLLELIICYLNLGFRLKELTHLEWEYIDFNASTITITRTRNKNKKKKRIQPMNQVVKELLLRRYLKRDKLNTLVFPGTRNKTKPCDFRYRLAALRTAAIKAGIKDFFTHDLRRTFGTMIRRMTDIVSTRDLMGHTSVTTTEDYTQAAPEHLRKAVDDLMLANGTNLTHLENMTETEQFNYVISQIHKTT